MTRRYLCREIPSPGCVVRLDPATSHHVLRVAVLPRGRRLGLFDGRGTEAVGRLVGVEEGLAVVEVLAGSTEQVVPAPLPRRIDLLLSVCKGPPYERMLRMATELGATRLLPVLTHRAVPRGDRGERWERVLQAAAEQCGRADLPALLPALPLPDALALSDLPAVRLVLHPGGPVRDARAGDLALLVGPEGGLTPDELEAAAHAAFEQVGLGPLTLRADTAVAAALARYAFPPTPTP